MGDSNTIASHYLEGHSRVKAPARGPIPRLASVMEWGVVDRGEGVLQGGVHQGGGSLVRKEEVPRGGQETPV